MGWKKYEVSAEEVEEFVAQFQERARFLIDESLGVEAARVISDHGLDAIFVGDVGLAGRSDEDVAAYAKQKGRIILTMIEIFSTIGVSRWTRIPAWSFFRALVERHRH